MGIIFMFEYFLIYGCVVLFSFSFYLINDVNLKKLILVIMVFILASLNYFRDYSIGTDTWNYVQYFDILDDVSYGDVSNVSSSYRIEYVFLFISKVLIDIFPNYHYVFFIYSLFVYYLILSAFLKLKLNIILLAVSLFSIFPIYFYTFNILRQVVALSLVIYSLTFLFKNRNLSFFSTIVFASLFHFPSLICFIFYFLFNYSRFFIRNLIWLGGLIFTLIYLLLTIFNSYLGKYVYYFSIEDYSKPFSMVSLFLHFFIFIISLYTIRIKGVLNVSKDFLFLTIVVFIFLSYNILLYVTGISNQGLNRLGFYFYWASMFLVVKNFKINFKGDGLILVYFLWFLFSFLWFYYLLSGFSSDLVPYKFFISG